MTINRSEVTLTEQLAHNRVTNSMPVCASEPYSPVSNPWSLSDYTTRLLVLRVHRRRLHVLLT